jgi:prophage regulatory protein
LIWTGAFFFYSPRIHTTKGGYKLKVIRPAEIKEYAGLSKNSAFRLEKLNMFPKRRQLGPSAVGWISTEIDEWIANRPVVTTENARTVAVGGKRGRPRKNIDAA